MKELDKKARYLGNPLFVGRNKLAAFEDLRRKVEARIQGWKAKLLPQSGRATLIKHVAISIPIYTMSTCLLPKSWCDNLEKSVRNFLWKNDPNVGGGFPPVAWSKVCQPKSRVELGFKNLRVFNKALVAKLGWSLVTEDNKLWVRAIKAKYFPYTTFLKGKKKKGCSWIWSGVPNTKPLLAKGVYFRVGKGDSVNIWEDPWIPNNPNFLPIPINSLNPEQVGMVSSLKMSNGRWNESLLIKLFDPDSVVKIKGIFWADNSKDD